MQVPLGETTPSKFKKPLPRVSLSLPLSLEDHNTIFNIMVKPHPISDLKVF